MFRFFGSIMTKKTLIIMGLFAVVTVSGLIIFKYQKPSSEASAWTQNLPTPTIYWTGGGADNKWSTVANWSETRAPDSADIVGFSDQSTKNSEIDTGFSGIIDSIIIDYSYSGTITQQTNFMVTNIFNQDGGTFISDPSLGFSAGSFFVATNQISGGQINVVKKGPDSAYYIGGTFTELNGLPIKYIAKFDGKRWSQVGGVLSGSVNAIQFDVNGNLYIGGSFASSGTTTLNSIAKLNAANNTWESLGGGVTAGASKDIYGDVKALVFDDSGNLYVGGSFLYAGSGYLNSINIAKWNGSWSKLGSYYGLSDLTSSSGSVDSLFYKDNMVYIGGKFIAICKNEVCTSIDFVSSYMASFNLNTSQMVAFGEGTGKPTQKVVSIKFDNNSPANINIVTGGALKKWDGTSWVNLFSGNNTLYAADFIGSDYFYGGNNMLGRNSLYWLPNYRAVSGGAVYAMENIDGKILIGGAFSLICHKGGDGSCNQNNAVDVGGGLIVFDPSNNSTTSLFNQATFKRFTGVGTITDPYMIQDNFALQSLVSLPTFTSYTPGPPSTLAKQIHFKLGADLDLAQSEAWNNSYGFLKLASTTRPFSGNISGAKTTSEKYSISNLKVSNADFQKGLFGLIETIGSIQDINFSDANLEAQQFIKESGILCAYNKGTISRVNLSGSISANAADWLNFAYGLGGLVGKNEGIIEDTSVNISGALERIGQFGGLVGIQQKGKITGSSSNGSITLNNSRGQVGGLVGVQRVVDTYNQLTNSTEITNSNSNLNLTVNNSNEALMNNYATVAIGGLVGENQHNINSSHAEGSLNCTSSVSQGSCSRVGGLVGSGLLQNNISNSYSKSPISITGQGYSAEYIGGLVGWHEIGSIISSYSTGAIDINYNGAIFAVGGLIGLADQSSINDVNSSSNLNLNNSSASIASPAITGEIGGLFGILGASSVSHAVFNGSINFQADPTCQTYGGSIGGFAGSIEPGLSSNSVSFSSARGNVTANCANVGGFSGALSGQVSESFSLGNVTGQLRTGGFAGLINGEQSNLVNSYSRGAVTTNITGGSFAGEIRYGAKLQNVYGSGGITGSGDLGGFVGTVASDSASFNNNYYLAYAGNYNTDPEGVVGLDSNQMRQQINFSGWDFTNIWENKDNTTYPTLINNPQPAEIQPQTKLEMAADKTSAKSGDEVTYTLTFTNESSQTLENINVESIIPLKTSFVEGSSQGATVADAKISWTIISLGPNTNQQFTYKVRVD